MTVQTIRLENGAPRTKKANTSAVPGVVIPETDLGNAQRLIALHGDNLRHVHAWNSWLAWDGKCWVADEHGAVMRCAVATTKTLVTEALEKLQSANERLAKSVDDDAAYAKARESKKNAENALKWAIRSQSKKLLEAMLSVARCDEQIAVSHDRFDADPWLLNVENGIVDLRTGKLRPHDRAALITKLAPVKFDANAKCPTWEKFLGRAMGGDTELVSYLQRVVGYALTGSTREHVLGFFFGGGANGKTTFLSTIGAMLGDYATPANRGLLFRGKGDRHSTELATLFGRRFVTCSEIGDGQSFDEPLVKDLTGGDPINCRRMRENEWSFVPTHKLFLAGNYRPNVRGDDEGIWRRLRLIPFTVTIPEADRDKQLPEKLVAELPGILAWAVRGCIEWQEHGLGDPLPVVEATADYRAESDTIGDFFRSSLTFVSGRSH